MARHFHELGNPPHKRHAAMFACIVGFLYYLGSDAYGTVIGLGVAANGLMGRAVLIAWALAVGLTAFAVAYPLLSLCERHSVTVIIEPGECVLSSCLNAHTLRVALLLMLCWMPYLVIRFPGNWDPDTIDQLLRGYGFSGPIDHHPWFDNLLYTAFWRLGETLGSHAWSLLIYALVQMLLTASFFALGISYLEALGCQRSITLGLSCFWAFFPVVPLYAQAMNKDCTNGTFWVLFLVLFAEIIRTKGKAARDAKYQLLCIACFLLLSLTKKPGIYVVLICGLFAAVWCARSRLHAAAPFVAAAFLYLVVWEMAILPSLGVVRTEVAEALSVPSQQVALYVRRYSSIMDDEDWDVLSRVYREPWTMGDVYNPTRADASKGRFINDSPTEDRLAFAHWYVTKMIEHPRTFLLAFVANGYPLFCVDITTEGDESLLGYRDNIPAIDSDTTSYENGEIEIKLRTEPSEEVRALFSGIYRPPTIGRISRLWDSLFAHLESACAVLFSKVLFTTWVPLFLAMLCIARKDWERLLCLLPIVVATAVLAAGPIVLPRYMVLHVYGVPFVAALGMVCGKKEAKEA